MIRVGIGGPGNKGVAQLSDERTLIVSQSPNPASLPQMTRPVVQLLANSAGGTVMSGATSGEMFTIKAPADADRYITQLGFVITGAGGTLNEFGTGNSLTNGCILRWFNSTGSVDIGVPLRSNWDFVRLAQGQPAYGNGTSAFRASNVDGNEEGFTPVVDFTRFLPPYGLRLVAGSTQRLEFIIQDTINATNVPTLNAMAYGFDRLV